MGNLAHFMHKIALFNNSMGLKPEQGAEPPGPLTLTNLQLQQQLQQQLQHCFSDIAARFSIQSIILMSFIL